MSTQEVIFVDRLNQLMREMNISKEELAIICDTSYKTIVNATNGKYDRISVEFLCKVAALFKVSTDWLLGYSNERIVHTMNDLVTDEAKID